MYTEHNSGCMLYTARMANRNSRVVISPYLLVKLDSTKKVPDRYKLGMSEWTDSADSVCEKENDAADFQPSKKLPSLKGKQRICEMVSSEELESISKGFVPKYTE